MPKEINPKNSSRAMAHELWMKVPNPMVTFFKTLDVTNLLKVSRKRNLKFNMLLCYCIAKAAVRVEEFYILPVGEKLMQYDTIAVSTIVNNNRDGINFCDIPYAEDLEEFNRAYAIFRMQRIWKNSTVRIWKTPHGSVNTVKTLTCRATVWSSVHRRSLKPSLTASSA